jgi:hypothetical protein
LGLVCTRMPRPPAALVWVADEEEEEEEVELEQETSSGGLDSGGGQGVGTSAEEGGEEGDAYRTAQAARAARSA